MPGVQQNERRRNSVLARLKNIACMQLKTIVTRWRGDSPGESRGFFDGRTGRQKVTCYVP
jgi:hypothetical protein